MRKLFERGFAGDMRAIQLLIMLLARAQTRVDVEGRPEGPLTEEELALLEMMSKRSGG